SSPVPGDGAGPRCAGSAPHAGHRHAGPAPPGPRPGAAGAGPAAGRPPRPRSSRHRRAASAAGAARAPGPKAARRGSRAPGLALGQHAVHQVHPLAIVHLPPAGDLVRGPVAAHADAIAVEGAHANAGGQDRTELDVHVTPKKKAAPACADAAVVAARWNAAAGQFTLTSWTSNTTAWFGPIGDCGVLPYAMSGGSTTSQREPACIRPMASRSPASGISPTVIVTGPPCSPPSRGAVVSMKVGPSGRLAL